MLAPASMRSAGLVHRRSSSGAQSPPPAARCTTTPLQQHQLAAPWRAPLCTPHLHRGAFRQHVASMPLAVRSLPPAAAAAARRRGAVGCTSSSDPNPPASGGGGDSAAQSSSSSGSSAPSPTDPDQQQQQQQNNDSQPAAAAAATDQTASEPSAPPPTPQPPPTATVVVAAPPTPQPAAPRPRRGATTIKAAGAKAEQLLTHLRERPPPQLPPSLCAFLAFGVFSSGLLYMWWARGSWDDGLWVGGCWWAGPGWHWRCSALFGGWLANQPIWEAITEATAVAAGKQEKYVAMQPVDNSIEPSQPAHPYRPTAKPHPPGRAALQRAATTPTASPWTSQWPARSSWAPRCAWKASRSAGCAPNAGPLAWLRCSCTLAALWRGGGGALSRVLQRGRGPRPLRHTPAITQNPPECNRPNAAPTHPLPLIPPPWKHTPPGLEGLSGARPRRRQGGGVRRAQHHPPGQPLRRQPAGAGDGGVSGHHHPGCVTLWGWVACWVAWALLPDSQMMGVFVYSRNRLGRLEGGVASRTHAEHDAPPQTQTPPICRNTDACNLAGAAGPHTSACHKQGLIICHNSQVEGDQVRGCVGAASAAMGGLGWEGGKGVRLCRCRGVIQGRMRASCSSGALQVPPPLPSDLTLRLSCCETAAGPAVSAPQGSSMDFLMKMYLKHLQGDERVRSMGGVFEGWGVGCVEGSRRRGWWTCSSHAPCPAHSPNTHTHTHNIHTHIQSHTQLRPQLVEGERYKPAAADDAAAPTASATAGRGAGSSSRQ